MELNVLYKRIVRQVGHLPEVSIYKFPPHVHANKTVFLPT